MTRVSMKEFGRGLPVKQVNPKAPRVPEQNQQGGTFGRALADIPNDVATSFKNSLGVIGDTGTNIKEAFTTPGLSIPQRAAGAISAPISGAVNLAAEGITGAGRLLTTPEFEEQLNGAIAQGGEAALNSEWGKWAVKQYEALPDEQKYTLTNIIGPVANTMTAGIGGVGAKQVASQGLRSIQNTLRSGAKTAGKDVVERTSQDAAQAILTAANPVEAAGNPVVDTIKGAATQIKDFATRTSREAQETASESRRMAQMPKEKGTLIKNGADEKVVNVIDRSTPEEVSIYRELVQQAKAKESDPTPNTPQPKVIAGREFMKPVQFLIDERKKVGTQLGERRKGLSTETDIDTNVAFRQFHEYLVDNKGAKFDTDGKILTDSGTLASSDIPKIQELYDQLASGKLNSEAELDSWLQRSLKDFDLVQKREKTFSDEVSSIAGVARGYVGELMPADYNALRKQYAEMSTPLSDMVKLLGYKGNLDEFSAKELKISEVALRVLGNAADRPQSVIDGVLDTAKANGYASTVDLNKLIYVTDQLEDLYDITPTRGFSGSTARGNNQSSAGIATDAATFNVGGLFDRAMSSRASQKEIQESFEAYLNSIGEGTGTPGTFKPGQTVKDEAVSAAAKTEAAAVARQAKSDSFEREPSLTPENKAIEDAAFNKILDQEDELLAQYKNIAETEGGTVINTDLFRTLFKDEGYVGSNAAAVQEPSSYLSKKAFTEALENPGETVVMTAGGSGTGKSSALKGIDGINEQMDDAAFVFDSNLSSINSALKKIEEAHAADKDIIVDYVYRDPLDAFENGVVARMLNNEAEAGRLVPSKVVAGNHIGSLKVVRELEEKHGVTVNYVDNSLGGPKYATVVDYDTIFNKANYPSVEELTGQFNEIAKRLLDEGTITPEQYAGYIE